jgi:hypothetical protein
MQLCLVVPGLLWPRQAHYDAAHDLDLPALAQFLGRSDLRWEAAQAYESWLGQAVGIDAGEVPVAALRRWAAGEHPQDEAWICADAAHISLEHGTPALAAVGLPDLADDEAARLGEALVPVLAPLGEFHFGAGGLGNIRLRDHPALVTTPPSAAIGRRADTVEARGPAAQSWQHALSEAQILLHQHEVNRHRVSTGRLPMNSLWLWGAGKLPRPASAPAWRTLVAGNAAQPLASALAAWSGTSLQPLTDAASLLAAPGPTLACVDDLLPTMQQFDGLAWAEGLGRLDEIWLAPLVSALQQGRLSRLTLIGLGDEVSLHATLTSWSRRRFWRRALPLSDLTWPAAA